MKTLREAADAYVAANGFEHSGGVVERAFEAGAKWAAKGLSSPYGYVFGGCTFLHKGSPLVTDYVEANSLAVFLQPSDNVMETYKEVMTNKIGDEATPGPETNLVGAEPAAWGHYAADRKTLLNVFYAEPESYTAYPGEVIVPLRPDFAGVASPSTQTNLIVKPLVWSRWPEDGTVQFEGLGQKRRYMARALTPFGAIFLMSRNGVEFTLVASGSQKTDEGTFGCAEDAKAAAQADYARRILSALASEGPAEWQWRSRLKGGAWDAWENGRYGPEIPPFMEVEERRTPQRTEVVWVQNLKGFIEGNFPADERWKRIFLEKLDQIIDGMQPPPPETNLRGSNDG